ncbi:hypothetical protein DL239_00920 [Sedimentitalea sp. CY04]|uniref:Antibiotic biosynthesis monooxygenase n=1 Tax=Parasedimentitalea denitrificans TaxID=2211118 RepID=A0ABX0W4I4_9RHOB|nr:hypothetical protein [Sedimentitalea sp. CY04]NIZ59532.1 hypothetical protein [Sedimentitalea sp. CY04]
MFKSIISAGAVALSLTAQMAFAEDKTILEIAWFKLVPGTEETQMLEGAQHVQDKFLPRFDGRIYRELMAEEGGDYWIDSIHWRSVGDFAEAAAEILVDPDGAPIMELIDISSMAWFHADRIRHWQTADIPQGDGYTELQVFRLIEPGSELEFLYPTTEPEFLTAAEDIQTELAAQPGFTDRELFRTGDGWWLDLVHWTAKDAADAAKAAIMADMADMESATFKFMTKIDPKSVKTFNMNQKRVW